MHQVLGSILAPPPTQHHSGGGDRGIFHLHFDPLVLVFKPFSFSSFEIGSHCEIVHAEQGHTILLPGFLMSLDYRHVPLCQALLSTF